jgi:putative DNA primase/helicase
MTAFTPTHEWQAVPDGAVLPAGCQTRMNLETEQTEARIALEPHLEDAWRFLELLDADADSFVFQVFDDGPQKLRSLGKTMFGSLDLCADPLRRHQEAGAGVFITVNATVGGRRTAVSVERIRANFADLDGAPLDPVLACDLEPHVVVESSPGKFHAYWMCEGVELDQFTPLQKAIAARFGGDPKVCDLPRVMRLPGYWHQKGTPFQTRIVQVNERLPYHADELLAEFPAVAAKPPGGNRHDSEDGEAQTMADLVRDVLTADNYHDALRNLAWRYLAGGMDRKDVTRTLQGMMNASTAPRDERWGARYNDIPRAVESAQRKHAAAGIGDLTDDGLALAMGRDWEPDSRYCELWRRWVFWGPNGWEIDETKYHLTRCRGWLRDKAEAITQARPSLRKAAKALRDHKTIYAINRLVTTNIELGSRVSDWDRDPMLLGGKQTVDLRTGETYDPRPADYILKCTSCEPAPAGTPAPLWHRFLDRVTDEDAELKAYLQRACGYWLTGSVKEEVFFFIFGTGANGKSKFVSTVQNIMDDYAITIGSEMLMVSHNDRHPTELAGLRGRRLAVAYEIEHGRTWAESKIKALTGGDKITARFMRADFFEYTPQFKLVLIGNHKPRLRAVDEAIKRRLHLIPFTVCIPPKERDPHLSRKLEIEHPGILRWMIDGAVMWRQQGLNPPERVRAATEKYLASEDSFELWRADCTVSDPKAWESSEMLWSSWRVWAEKTGEVVGTQRAFSDLLIDHGFVPQRYGKKQTRGYRGAKLVRMADIIKETMEFHGQAQRR